MKKRELEDWEKAECAALKAEIDAFNEGKSRKDSLTQGKIADALEIGQGSVSSYLNGYNALNARVAGIIAGMISVPVERFSQRLADEIAMMSGSAGTQKDKESNVIQADFRAPVRPSMIDIPYLDTAGSMGRGIERKESDNVIQRLTIERAYLKSLVSFSLAENLALITGYGDSMKPTFSDGDIMLVDRGVTEVKIDAVYVLAKNDEIFIKRLQRRSDGSFLMISDNKAYEPEAITDMDRFEVLGRVIYVWAGSKL